MSSLRMSGRLAADSRLGMGHTLTDRFGHLVFCVCAVAHCQTTAAA
jgi:hypothetical protein